MQASDWSERTQPHHATTSTPVLIAYGTPRTTQLQPGQRVTLPRLPATERPPTTALIPRQPRPARTRRRALQAGTVVITVVIGLIAVAAVRGASGPSPKDLVRNYFAALTARDSTALRASVSCTSNPVCEVGTLRAGYQPPENLSIDSETSETPSVTTSGAKQRRIQVSYDIAGQRITDTITVLYRRTGMFSGYWSILDPPGATITMPEPVVAATTLAAINPKTTTATRDQPSTFWIPAGRYTATRPGTALFEPAETTVVVVADPATVTLPATLKPAVTGDIEQQIHDRIDACAAQRLFQPDTNTKSTNLHTCPFKYLNRYTVTDDPQWSIQRYPTIRIEAHPDGTVTVTTTTPGTATIRYRWTVDLVEPRTWQPVQSTVDITVEGHVGEADGKPAWIPN